MTRICIILAVFLVTSIFSMMQMWMEAETTAMRENHGDWHIVIKNVSQDLAGQIRENSNIAFSSWYDEINADADQGYYINGSNAVLYGVEESYLTDIRSYPAQGVYPQNDKEVALSADAKEMYGIDVGSNITITTPAGDFEFLVSGFYEDDSEFNDIIGGSCVYMNRTAFDEIRSRNGVEPDDQYYIRFRKESSLKKTIADTMEQYHLTSENVDENTAVLGMLGVSSSESFGTLYQTAAVCFVIILASGVFMISSCMNSNVAQRTKFFGMMRCIGASKQQMIRFVRLEALDWCKTAIPAGCLLGTVSCWIMCAILKLFVKGDFVDMPLFSVSIFGILCGAIVGVVTVLLAAHSPAKQAAGVSPMAAVSGNAVVLKEVGHGINNRIFKVETSLGIHHAIEAKKNLLLMTGSFALVISLFLAFSACLDLARKLLPSVSDFTPDIGIISQDNTNSIDRSLVADISKISGVENATGTMYEMEKTVQINGIETEIDFMSYDEFMLKQYKKSVASGDLSKVYGNSDYVATTFAQNSRLDVGDKIKIGDHELEIACVMSEGVGSVSDLPVIVCSEETFMRVTGVGKYMMINVILGKDATDETVDEIQSMADDYIFYDRRDEDNETRGSYWVFRIAAYGFLAIISMITVLNIMNSIFMSVSARIKQYGAMRAVGMSSRQVTKMIAAEAFTYALSGTACGLVLGLLIHRLIYEKAILTHFGGSWNVPVTSVAVVLLLVSASCVAAVYAPSKRIQGMAVTETINEL
jgi:putative ABC transport system permease protein